MSQSVDGYHDVVVSREAAREIKDNWRETHGWNHGDARVDHKDWHRIHNALALRGLAYQMTFLIHVHNEGGEHVGLYALSRFSRGLVVEG